MKHLVLSGLCIAVLSMTFLGSCKKEVEKEATNPVTKIEPSALAGPGLSLTFKAGHSDETCVGQGLCHIHTYNSDGTFHTFHIPCQASGAECSWTIKFFASGPTQEGSVENLEGELNGYIDSEFLMPNVSIFLDDRNVFINNPAQRLQRVPQTGHFLFQNVQYTNSHVDFN